MVFVLSLFAVPAFAQVDTSGLSEAQKAELQAAAAQLRLENEKAQEIPAVLSDVTLGSVERYADIGAAVATSIGAAARELGMATNDFMGTGAGQLAVFLIVYHVIGADIVGLFVGFLIMCVATWLLVRYTRYVRHDRTETTQTESEKGKILTNTVVKTDKSGEAITMITLSTVVYLLVLWIVAANCMPG
jgi:hypothetical protein